MEKFKVIAESTTYYTIELEAENAVEAWDLAGELGKDSFTLDESYESTWYLCGMYSMDSEEWYDDDDDEYIDLPKKGTKERKAFDKEVQRLCDLVDSQMDGNDFIGHKG